jgi:hypothetical protein
METCLTCLKIRSTYTVCCGEISTYLKPPTMLDSITFTILRRTPEQLIVIKYF